MNVLYFADTRFPIERANGTQTMATCQALAARGHAVTLVVRPDTAAPARDPFAFYGVPRVPSLFITTIPSRGHARRRRVTFLMRAWWLSRAHPTAIICTRDLGLASFLLRTRGPKLLYESHGVSAVVSEELPRLLGQTSGAPSRAKLRRLDRRDARVWRRAASYVSITRALHDDLTARYGPRPAAAFVVPDGAREPPAPVTAEAGASAAPPVIAAYAGHLYPWKGVDVFVHALALAPGIHGLIVGGHPQESDYARVDALARSLGLGNRLRFAGFVPPGEVAHHLTRASMLVLPNTASVASERYTSPLKLFEYLWLGRPIVASDLASIREVLTDRQTALLVPPGDAAALAAALERLAANPALAQSLGASARALAPEYTWARRAERLEAALTAAARA